MNSVKTLICILSLLLTLPLLSGCGKRGALTLPLPHAPKALKEMELRQIGNRIHITFTIPAALQDSEEIAEENIRQIMIYCTNEQYKDGKFKRRADVIMKKSPEHFKKLAPFKYETAIAFDNDYIDNRVLSFSIRYKVKRKKSPLGEIFKIETHAPPQKIREYSADKRGKLVILKWKPPVINASGEAISGKLNYNVYRYIVPVSDSDEKPVRKMRVPEFPEGFVKLNQATTNYYEDITGSDGKYIYCITSIRGKTESLPAIFKPVSVKDEFPPAEPGKLLSMSAAGHIYLTWKRNSETDFSHYNVYRKKAGEEEFELIAEKVKTPYYKDTKVTKGDKYSYTVTAVDSSDNESEYSVIVTEEYI